MEYFKGELKDISVFSTVRSPEEISADINGVQPGTEGLICSYDIDETDMGKDITDLSGNGYDLKYNQTWLSEEEMEEIRKSYGEFKSDYSFAVFGDTQKMTENYPNSLVGMYQWVADNKDEMNIVYSLGLGDITDDNGAVKFSKDENGKWIKDDNGEYDEWDVAKDAVTRMNGIIPYSLVRGNHDIMNSRDTFNQTFGDVEVFISQFNGTNGGKYTDTGVKDPITSAVTSYANTWTTFSVNVDGENIDYLFLNLDFGFDDNVLAWAAEVISQERFKDHRVILSTHTYLYNDGTTEDAGDATPPTVTMKRPLPFNNGDDMWNEFVSQHPNIYMVLSGHIDSNQIIYNTVNAHFEDKINVVTEMLINPQAVDYRLRSGMVAFLMFDESENKIAVEYYSPTRDAYFKTASQFVIDLDDPGIERIPEKWDGTTLTKPDGEGTEAEPYIVSSPANLLWMSKQIIDNSEGSCFKGVYFKQTCDIDLDGKAIQSIGYSFANFKSMYAFSGNYDGGGYSIKNGTIAPVYANHGFETSFGHGLFGAIYGAVIENVVLEDVQIIGRGVTGAIVGIAASPEVASNDEFVSFNIISGCEVKDTVRIVVLRPDSAFNTTDVLDDPFRAGRVGSVCGMARATLIEGCMSAASLALTEDFTLAGGIAGTAGLNTVIESCAFTGEMTLAYEGAMANTAYGGIVGAVSPSDVTKDMMGAALGFTGDLTLKNCYNTRVGNIIGYSVTGDGGVYSETNCLNAASSEIDAAIDAIAANGTARVWNIGSGAPTAELISGSRYMNVDNGDYYSGSDGVWTKISNLGMTTNSLETPYGNIPVQHMSSPMVSFTYSSKGWTFLSGYDSYTDMNEAVRQKVTSSKTAKVVVYFRGDVTIDGHSTNLGWNVGTIIFDLGGKTLYQAADKSPFPAVAKYHKSYTTNPDVYGAPGNFEVMNGNIVLANKPLFEISAYGADYKNNATDTVYKIFNYTFSNVHISLAEGSSLTQLFGAYGESSTVCSDFSQKMLLNARFEDDCTIDISNATKKINLFNANDSLYKGLVSGKSYYNTNSITNIEVGAIDVISDSASFTWFTVNKDNGSSVIFTENTNGGRARLTVPTSVSPALNVDLDGNLGFSHDLYKYSTDSTANTATYTLVETPYGSIGSTYADSMSYPCIVFEVNADGTYKVHKGYSNFADAVNNAKYTSLPDKTRVVYVRRNITSGTVTTNLCWSVSRIIIDLGTHTVTPEKYFLPCTAKWQKEQSWKNDPVYGEPGYFEIINGEIVLNNYGLFQINSFSALYNTDADDTHYKALYYAFRNVKITLAKGAALDSITGTFEEKTDFTTGNKKMLLDITYDNCVFDLAGAKNTVKLFDANDEAYIGKVAGKSCYNTNTVVKIHVGSVEVIEGDAAVIRYDCNPNNSSCITVTVPKGSIADLSGSYDGKMDFVKISEDDISVTYSLAPNFVKEYVPNVSVTLDSNLIINVYIPVENTQKFTFNGETYENLATSELEKAELNGAWYYITKVELPANEAASEITLTVTVSLGDKTAVGSFVFSVPRYAEKVLESNASAVEKALVKDILAYVNAAYLYFNAGTVKAINDIIGDYSAELERVDDTAVHNSELVSYVTFILDACPAIRFYLPEGVTSADGYTFRQGNSVLKITGSGEQTLEDGKAYHYVDISLYAYAMISTVTYEKDGNVGSYHINDYLDFVSGESYQDEDKEVLVSLVEKMYNYFVSASKYRNSVTN